MMSGIPTGKYLWKSKLSVINVSQPTPIFSLVRFARRMTSKMLFSVVWLILLVSPSLAFPTTVDLDGLELRFNIYMEVKNNLKA